MREYGQISTRWWQSQTISGLPNDSARYLFVYLIAGPHTNSLGCFRLPKAYVSEDLGYSIETVSELFGCLQTAGLIRYCDRTKWLLVPNFLLHQPPRNGNVGTSIAKMFGDVPENSEIFEPLCFAVLANPKHLPEEFLNRIETVSKRYRNIDHDYEHDYEHDHKGENPGTDLLGDKTGTNGKAPPCPHRQIIALYHEALPELPAVNVELWNGQRQQHLQARWREHPAHQSLDYWRDFFAIVRTNPHWMGDNDRGWKADMGWLVKPANFVKVVERGMQQ